MRLERIGLQDRLAGGLIQEQALQNQIQLITRQNFDLTKQSLEARLAAIPPSQALAANTYNMDLARLRAQSAIVSIVQGQAPKYDLGSQFGAIRGAAMAAPDLKIADLTAQYAVLTTNNAEQSDILAKQIASIRAQKQLQDLRLNEINNINLLLAVNQAQNDQIQRHLELQTLDLANQAKLLAAEVAISNARKLQADAAERIAVLAAGNVATGGIGSISVTVDVGNLVVGPDLQELLNQIGQATTRGVLDAVNQGGGASTPRLPAGMAGAR